MIFEPIASALRPLRGSAARRYTVLWFLRLLVVAAPIAGVALAITVGPAWFSEQPRAFRRAVIELLLHGLSAVEVAIFAFGILGTSIFGWLTLRTWRKRVRRTSLERGFLLGLSCLLALLGLELGATVWRGWTHRLPRLPTAFAPSPPDEYRIVVLGGSSAVGEPFRPWLSVGQIVAWRLEKAVPNRRFVCELLAWLGHSLEQQHRKLAGIDRRPDAVIVYSGHNEFAARFGEERDAAFAGEPANRLMRRIYDAASISPFQRLCREIYSRNRVDSPPLSGRHQLIDPPVCNQWESEEVLADFSKRLEAIVSYCEQIGALPILIIPPANEARYEPSRSTLASSVSTDERLRLFAEIEAARADSSGDPEASATRYRSILARHPEFAEAHFRLAELLERQGKFKEAAEHYRSALDNDGLPIRCTAPFCAAYREVASRHPRSILIDGPQELRKLSQNGLLGEEMIVDTHHPTFGGYLALAGAVLREMARRSSLNGFSTIDLPLDGEDCARHFGMGADAWATACDRTSVHFDRVAWYRYDPVARLAQSRRYAEAARQLRAGVPIKDLDLPGITSPTRPASPASRRSPRGAGS
jgi:hypothetical protein